jgi:hypothetical protein
MRAGIDSFRTFYASLADCFFCFSAPLAQQRHRRIRSFAVYSKARSMRDQWGGLIASAVELWWFFLYN